MPDVFCFASTFSTTISLIPSPPLKDADQDHEDEEERGWAPDAESDRLRFELAQAMNARRDSEQRIQLLREQMTRRSVQQDQHWAATARASHSLPSTLRSLPRYDPYLASLIAAAGGSPPLLSRSCPPVGGGESTSLIN